VLDLGWAGLGGGVTVGVVWAGLSEKLRKKLKSFWRAVVVARKI